MKKHYARLVKIIISSFYLLFLPILKIQARIETQVLYGPPPQQDLYGPAPLPNVVDGPLTFWAQSKQHILYFLLGAIATAIIFVIGLIFYKKNNNTKK